MYDHSVWIELRCALEDFLWQSSDLLGKLDEMREDLNANDFADDVTSAKQVGYFNFISCLFTLLTNYYNCEEIPWN